MAKLEWDSIGSRNYEYGVDHVVAYPRDGIGSVWNGVYSIEENSSEGEMTPCYYEGVVVANLKSSVDFQAKLSAFSSPKAFQPCDGMFEPISGLIVTQQVREMFGLSYRTKASNDLGREDYILHLVYNILATPENRSRASISDNPALTQLVWSFDTIPPYAENTRRTAHIVIDSRKFAPEQMSEIEILIYGSDTTAPKLPDQSDVLSIFEGVR